jgi:hypothetical protein
LAIAIVAVVIAAVAIGAIVVYGQPPAYEETGSEVGLVARMVNNITEMQIMVNGLHAEDNSTPVYPLSSLRMDVVTSHGLEGSINLGSLAWNGNITANGTLMSGFMVHMERSAAGPGNLQKFDFIIIDCAEQFEYQVWTINIINESTGTRVGGLIMPINGLTCCG